MSRLLLLPICRFVFQTVLALVLCLLPDDGAEHLAWDVQVLAEPIQTVMRKYAVPEPYEKLKAFSRGKAVTAASMAAFVDGLEGVPADAKAEMRQWTPATYIGNAAAQAKRIRDCV